MGYIGPVSSVWMWRPSQATISEQWKTLVTEFESGAEQRRSKWETSRVTFKYQFERGALTTDEVQDIWRFYMRQRGAYGTFLAPAYGNIMTRLSATYLGSFQIIVDQTQDFTSNPASHWNKFYVEDSNGSYGFFTVGSVVNATTITVSAISIGSFGIGAWVCPAIMGRFSEDTYNIDFMMAMLTTVGLGITECHS
jgi:hypothetical protein